MSDVQTKKAVVVSDGLTYKVPGQDKPVVAFGFAQTYLTLPATRGDEIELSADDYDRFKALGAIADPDSAEAGAAKAEPMRWGDPANAVRISGEDGTLPIDKLRQEAKRLGVYADPFGEDDEPDEGVSGAVPEGFDVTDAKAVKRLNVAQLKAAAAQHGVNVEGADTKAKLQDALVKHGKSAAKS